MFAKDTKVLVLNRLPETLHLIKYTDTVSNACNTCIYGHPTYITFIGNQIH